MPPRARIRSTTPTIFVVLVVLAGGVAAASPVAAGPAPLPAAYYGELTINGEPAPAGVTVTAEIDGEVRGTLTTDREGEYGGPAAFDPKLQVNGTEDDDGRTVTFRVAGVDAGTATWHASDIRRLNLAASGVDLGDGDASGGGGGGSGGTAGGGGAAGDAGTTGNDTDTGSVDGDLSGPAVQVQRAPAGGVDISVESARANESVRIETAVGNETDVGLDSLAITPTRNGSFSLSVTPLASPPADTPAYSAGGNGTTFGYFRIDHTIADANLSRVTFMFRVRKDRLAASGTAPEAIVLGRYTGEGWTDLPSLVVGETDTHYRFSATSPGLSVFAIRGVVRPVTGQPQVTAATLNRTVITVGETVVVTATVRNPAPSSTMVTLTLRIDGTAVDTRTVSVPGENTTRVTFSRTFGEPGEYAVAIEDVTVGTVTVKAVRMTTTSPTPIVSSTAVSTTTTDGVGSTTITTNERPAPRLPGFGAPVAVAALVLFGAVFFAVRYRRRRR